MLVVGRVGQPVHSIRTRMWLKLLGSQYLPNTPMDGMWALIAVAIVAKGFDPDLHQQRGAGDPNVLLITLPHHVK